MPKLKEKPNENGTLVQKYFISKADSEPDGTIVATISSGSIDRDNEVLIPQGGDFKNYLKNPLVLWAHGYYDPPIAKALWIRRRENVIKAKMKFADTEFAQEIYELYKGGFLNAFSIGFQVKAGGSRKPTKEDIKENPKWKDVFRIFDKWEMLEFSAVPVPANPEALAEAVKTKQLSLSDDMQKFLEPEEEVFYPMEQASNETETKEPEPELEPEEKIIEVDEAPLQVDEIEKEKTVDVQSFIDVNELIKDEKLRAKGVVYV